MEGLYKSEITGFCSTSHCVGLVRSRNCSKKWTAEKFTNKTAERLHDGQMKRNRNFRVHNDVVERGSVTNSHNGNKACVERKVGECLHWKAHGPSSKGDSCSFHDPPASGNKGSGQRRKGRSSSSVIPFEGQGLTVNQATEMKALTRRSQILCRYKKL